MNYNTITYQILEILCVLFVIIVIIQPFTFHYFNNQQLLVNKTFAKESKEIHQSKQSIQEQQQLAIKELLGISSPNITNSNSDIIPQIYPSKVNGSGEEFRLNKTNPNDMVQVDETKRDYIFTKQNKDGS